MSTKKKVAQEQVEEQVEEQVNEQVAEPEIEKKAEKKPAKKKTATKKAAEKVEEKSEEAAAEQAEQMEEMCTRWPQEEATLLCRLELAVSMGDGRALRQVIEQAHREEGYLSMHARQRLACFETTMEG